MEYIKDNYEFKDDFFYINNKTSKVIVENAYIDYLLTMRQEKINELGDEVFYINNELLLSVILESMQKYKDKNSFEKNVIEKLEATYSSLSKSAYDFSLEIMNYIKDNFDFEVRNISDFFSRDVVNDSITVRDKFIQYLLLMR